MDSPDDVEPFDGYEEDPLVKDAPQLQSESPSETSNFEQESEKGSDN